MVSSLLKISNFPQEVTVAPPGPREVRLKARASIVFERCGKYIGEFSMLYVCFYMFF